MLYTMGKYISNTLLAMTSALVVITIVIGGIVKLLPNLVLTLLIMLPDRSIPRSKLPPLFALRRKKRVPKKSQSENKARYQRASGGKLLPGYKCRSMDQSVIG